jgi:tetratricopeptide (TPR) repeat protein
LRVCNDALAIDGDNTKALYRRASVYYEKKKWDLANKDIQKASKVAPDDKAIKKLQERIDAQLKRQKLKEKKMAQKMFG